MRKIATPIGEVEERYPPEEALRRLIQGNERYAEDRMQHPDRTKMRREAVTQRQNPFAIIVGCSDSRVPPEIIFDQGLGDLFVVRVAGQVVGPIELDSIGFAAEYLGSSVILVLGHESCGAVTAVLNDNTQDIESVAGLIKPAIEKAKEKGLEQAIKANVRHVVKELKEKKLFKRYISEGHITVAGGYYHLSTGKVEMLDLP